MPAPRGSPPKQNGIYGVIEFLVRIIGASVRGRCRVRADLRRERGDVGTGNGMLSSLTLTAVRLQVLSDCVVHRANNACTVRWRMEETSVSSRLGSLYDVTLPWRH